MEQSDENKSPMYILEFDDLLPVNYEQQGDQWLDVLSKEIQARVEGANGHGVSYKQASSDFRYPHYEFVVNGMQGNMGVPMDIPTLKIVPVTQNGTRALLVALAATRPVTENDKKIWADSIAIAVEKLGEESPVFEWSAALGQANDPTTQKYSLKKRFTLHGIILRSGGGQYMDSIPSKPPGFTSSSFNLSWPIIVEGKSTGYDWMVAGRQAGVDVYKIAALLSLAWNSTWYLLDGPRPVPHGTLRIPTRNALGQQFPRLLQQRRLKVMPTWTDKAWTIINDDDAISDAVSAYYQGLLLEEKHPSFALMAFITSVEIIGRKIIGKRCPCCGGKPSSNLAFRRGVDEVISDTRKAKEFHLLYDSRSNTAHEGKLHASEDTLGHFPFPSFFRQDSKATFVFTDLRKVKMLSRKLLLQALRNKVKFGS